MLSEKEIQTICNLQTIQNTSSPESAGAMFKVIAQRLRDVSKMNDYPPKPIVPWGCLNCKHYVREEGYDQEWGRYAFFYHHCDKGLDDKYIVNGKDAPNPECFEEGEPTVIYMSEKEKEEIENSYHR